MNKEDAADEAKDRHEEESLDHTTENEGHDDSPQWLKMSILGGLIVAILIVIGIIMTLNPNDSDDSSNSSNSSAGNEVSASNINPTLTAAFDTDFSNTSLEDWSSVVSGGPGKDGIPSIDEPKFEPISETNIAETTRAMLVEINGQKRAYPYNILVWHEIVNDEIDGVPVAVTFCPLCGTAIAYEREIEGEVYEFGVSGFLRESNMIMFDRTTESLFQQSTGEGFAGDLSGKTLSLVQFQLLEIFKIKEKHPDAQIMTTETGHSRNYTVDVYNDNYNYDRNNSFFLFEPSSKDERFPLKELFYIVRDPLTSKSVAIRAGKLESGITNEAAIQESGVDLRVQKNTDGEIFVYTPRGQQQPGYFEMWFSWALWHDNENSVVFDPSTI